MKESHSLKSIDCLILVHTIQVKQSKSGDYELRVDDGEWKKCSVQLQPDESHQRFSMKCNLDGVVSTFSAVITSNQIDVFNNVSFCLQMKFPWNLSFYWETFDFTGR